MNRVTRIVTLTFAPWIGCLTAFGQFYPEDLPSAHPAIQYLFESVDDPLSRFIDRIESGEVNLDYAPQGAGYLESLLLGLDIDPESQLLVFSKTSLQVEHISPRTPRAIYFNDEVAVAFAQGAPRIEIASNDPRQGTIFYTLESARSENAGRAKFLRSEVCLHCHHGPATAGVPGKFVSSVFPSASGRPTRPDGIVTDHRTLFEERWGGWYVTGTHGARRHRGNAVASNPAEPELLEFIGTQNLTSLMGKVNTSAYLRDTSDLVALMVFEHQTQMTNLMTRLGWRARIARHGREKGDAESVRHEPDAQAVDELLRYLLFVEEDGLSEPIRGVSGFTENFAARGLKDEKGRSLRDFDLETRLFRYPLSYMIHSRAFDALPASVRDPVLDRLLAILTNRDSSESFATLSSGDRNATLSILRATKTNLPKSWYEKP